MESSKIPFWKKYILTISEAAKYFHLGEKRLREIALENPNANFILHNGNRVLIKKKLFEEFLDEIDEV